MSRDFNLTEDEKLAAIKTEGDKDLTDSNAMYDDIIADSTEGYDKLIQESKDWVDTQTALQDEKTNFAIDQINQQKDQTHKDYLKEQSGAYVDWQKQSNQYGVNAEKMAATGLTNTGYSESSRVSMYNTYQNRVAMARESYDRAVLNYDNAINQAILQNSSILAEIAYQGLSEQLKLGLEAMQYKNTLLIEKSKAQREIKAQTNSKWSAMLDAIYKEKSLEENARQYDENMAFQREQFEYQKQKDGGVPINKNTGNPRITSTKYTMTEGLNKAIEKSATNKKNTLIHNIQNDKGEWTYDRAIDVMNAYGLSDGGQRLLTSIEWQKGKKAGDQSSEFQNATYQEYVKNYLIWRAQNS